MTVRCEATHQNDHDHAVKPGLDALGKHNGRDSSVLVVLFAVGREFAGVVVDLSDTHSWSEPFQASLRCADRGHLVASEAGVEYDRTAAIRHGFVKPAGSHWRMSFPIPIWT